MLRQVIAIVGELPAGGIRGAVTDALAIELADSAFGSLVNMRAEAMQPVAAVEDLELHRYEGIADAKARLPLTLRMLENCNMRVEGNADWVDRPGQHGRATA